MLKKEEELCDLHNHEKTLYCINCQIIVCPVCFYEEERHRGHEKKVLNTIYQEKKTKLNQKNLKLNAQKIRLTKRKEEMSSKREEIKFDEIEKLTSMETFV